MQKTLTIAVLLLSAVSSIFASAPSQISFQGYLTDSGGDVVADASYSVVFTIYDDPSAGTSVWTETQNVTTINGLFAVMLGSINPITDTVFNNPTRYLGVAVSGDPELSPRTALVSVPYAQRVNTIDGAKGGTVTGDVDIQGFASIGSGNSPIGSEAIVLGRLNDASGFRSSVTGGSGNTASGGYAVVGGGQANNSTGSRSSVSGGHSNTASGDSSFVGGGARNTASGNLSGIMSGFGNLAEGSNSFILGSNDSIGTNGNYSIVIGVDGILDSDSTLMISMPYLLIGDNASGYYLPTTDGSDGQVLTTDGAGNVAWENPSAASYVDSAGSVTDGVIDNADINAAANIAVTKIEGTAVNLSSTQTITGSKTFDDLNISATTRYLSIPAYGFNPNSSTYDYARNLVLIGSTAGRSVSFAAPVLLPHGATLTNVSFYVYDNDGTRSLAGYLRRYPLDAPFGGDETLFSGITGSTETPGDTVLSGNTFLDPVIDNATYYYFALVSFTTPTSISNIALKGVLIEYEITKPLP